MKKLICLVLSCLLLFSLTSCAIIDRFKGDMSKLSYDDNHNLLYGDSRYYRTDDYFEVRTTADDTVVELGWYSQFPFFPDMYYYTFDEENPIFFSAITKSHHCIIKVFMSGLIMTYKVKYLQ